jgi:hypothetical protein
VDSYKVGEPGNVDRVLGSTGGRCGDCAHVILKVIFSSTRFIMKCTRCSADTSQARGS